MKKSTPILLIAMTIMGLLSIDQSFAQKVIIPVKLQKQIKPNKLPDNIVVPATLLKKDIDLAAEKIDFFIERKKDQFNGTIRVEGTVRNVGRRTYTSGTGQQVAVLYEMIAGGATRAVGSVSFRNVAPNAMIKVYYTRTWRTSDEFPPTYKLVIGFDPDLYIDGNVDNDDSNAANNEVSRSGADVNALNWASK
jgi:hypothetical protein